jgi:hypothetical protein
MKLYYGTIGEVYCPILRKKIRFNARGFHHLQYKPSGTARKPKEKIHKLSLVPLALPVIKAASSIHEERNIKIPYKSGKVRFLKNAKQIALVAMVGKRSPVKVRVIILEIEGSPQPIFWSIMKH